MSTIRQLSQNMSIRIKELRIKKGVTQLEMAKSLNKSQSAYAAWEAGDRRPPTDILPQLIEQLDTTYDYLFGASNRRTYKRDLDLLWANEKKTFLTLLSIGQNEIEILGEERLNALFTFYRFQLNEAVTEHEKRIPVFSTSKDTSLWINFLKDVKPT